MSQSAFCDCPCCGASVAATLINEHLDGCLGAPPGTLTMKLIEIVKTYMSGTGY